MEKSRVFLSCTAQGASVSAKRASLADARLLIGLGLAGLMVVEAFELLSWCCMATSHEASHVSSLGRLFFGRPRSRGAILAKPSERRLRPWARKRSATASLVLAWASRQLSAIPRSSNSGNLNRFHAEPTIQVRLPRFGPSHPHPRSLSQSRSEFRCNQGGQNIASLDAVAPLQPATSGLP